MTSKEIFFHAIRLPVPRAPTFSPSLLTRIWVDAFAIAVVSFAITLSLGRIFGQRHNYEVDANQVRASISTKN